MCVCVCVGMCVSVCACVYACVCYPGYVGIKIFILFYFIITALSLLGIYIGGLTVIALTSLSLSLYINYIHTQ